VKRIKTGQYYWENEEEEFPKHSTLARTYKKPRLKS
jgi:hypothetical protein